MSPDLLRRQAVLAAVALLAAVVALALGREAETSPGAPPAPEGAGSWREVRAGTMAADALGVATDCDLVLEAATLGVAHPVLPCGAQIVVEAGGRAVRVPVVAHEVPAERGLDLTPALAAALGVDGEGTVRWRFAG